MSPPNRRHFLRATGAGLGLSLAHQCGPPGLFEQEALAPEHRRKAGEATGRRHSHQPPRPRARQPDHRRLDLPGKPGPLRHPSVSRGLSRPVSPAVEDPAARDPGRVRPPVRRMVQPGLKGKYSLVPTRMRGLARPRPARLVEQELRASLELVHLITPNWDIHPEMVSHTWVIHTETGRPYPDRTPTSWKTGAGARARAPDELADTWPALKILKNAGIKCDGITTPGGFGNRALRLAQGTLEACRDVFSRKSLITSGTFSRTRASPRVEWHRAWTAWTRDASFRSSAARATGLAAGTDSRRARRPVHHGRPEQGRLPE